MNSPQNPNRNSDWVPCLPGIISQGQLARAAQPSGRRSEMFSVFLIYFCGAIIFGTVLIYWRDIPMRTEAFTAPEVSCEQVQLNLVDYADMNLCDSHLRAAISNHLKKCPKCDLAFQTLTGNHVNRPKLTAEVDLSKPSYTCTECAQRMRSQNALDRN